jgi:UDP-N-acetylglucosamine kinase
MNKTKDIYSSTEFENAYHDIYGYLTQNHDLLKRKCAYILGGQPGSGKSNYFKGNSESKNCIILNGDDYRKFHPKYDNIIAHGQQDMPSRTQNFCNAVVERLIDDFSRSGYNMVIEGTLRNPEVPIKTCSQLKNRGYHVNLIVMACDAELAWKSTLRRADQMTEFGEYPRFVSIDVYNYIVSNIIGSLEKISTTNCFDNISIINRDGILLHPNEQGLPPSEVLRAELNCENWKTVFPKYSKIFEVQKEIILQKASNMSGHSQEHQSVLQKLEQNKKLAADQNAHTAGLHKGRNGPVK